MTPGAARLKIDRDRLALGDRSQRLASATIFERFRAPERRQLPLSAELEVVGDRTPATIAGPLAR
jgi:hypothetical protein